MSDRYDPLVIYIPVVHGGRAGGLAKSLHHVGMRMMVTGPTASHEIKIDHRMPTARVRSAFSPSAFAVEGDEIFDNPPDIIVVGREDNLESTIKLRRQLNRIKPVAIVGYSGVFQSRYQYKKLDGLIATDKASRVAARYVGVPSLKFFPHFGFDRWPYEPEPEQSPVILRSFIRNYQERFPLSYAFHQECRSKLTEAYGDRVVVENFEKVQGPDVPKLLRECTASLHIKDQEGFGWSTVESLATGRPILWQSGLSRNMAFLEWMADGGEAFRFTTADDLVRLVGRFLEDPAWRTSVQVEAAETIRATFNVEDYAEALGDFLMAIATLTRLRWAPWRPGGVRKEIAAYAPTLDPHVLQDYERVALGGERAETIKDL